MAEISADISAKKRLFWIEPLTAYSRFLLPAAIFSTKKKKKKVCYLPGNDYVKCGL
jgi:hypothetical protein